MPLSILKPISFGFSLNIVPSILSHQGKGNELNGSQWQGNLIENIYILI
jgi:hypothetical protein